MSTNKKEFSARLRLFIEQNFKNISDAARHLEINESSLRNAYLAGKSFPGFEALLQLRKKGCDLNWLLTGKENFWEISLEMENRINFVIRLLVELHNIKEDELTEESISEEALDPSKEQISNRTRAKIIISHWQKYKSLSVHDLNSLSDLSVFDLKWFFTGKRELSNEIKESFIFNFPEVTLLLEMRKYPELFRKIKLYVESTISDRTADDINEIKKEIDSVIDKNEKNHQTKM